MRRVMALTILSLIFWGCGCSDFGRVDQGRVINYDKTTGIIIMIQDKSANSKSPDYSALPPVSYKLPVDPDETGPAPKAGFLLKIDLEKKEAVIFMEKMKMFETVGYTLVKQQKVADAKDPLVLDPATKKLKAFPIIDAGNKTIEIYLENKKALLTFSVPDAYFSLPPETWIMGDEVRVYYKTPGQALRFMNISKTDMFKK